GTFGGNPVSCAAGAATIRVIIDERLDINAKERGYQILKGLKEIQAEFPDIGDVRGLGLMAATEFVKNDESKSGYEPDPDIVNAVKSEAVKQKLLLLSCGTYGNVIRWIPPLIVTEKQINEALSIFRDVLKKITS
ncbi:MAG: aspartate aminotransferase family protein, partial [Spirochaetes bacterium]